MAVSLTDTGILRFDALLGQARDNLKPETTLTPPPWPETILPNNQNYQGGLS